jgi:ubiquitin carboxyl-terminal hydrolase 5/13
MRKEELYRTSPQRYPQEDFLTQTSKLFHYLYSKRYQLSDESMRRRKEAAAANAAGAKKEEAKDEKEKEEKHPEPGAGNACGYVCPRMFKGIIGKGHAEFTTNKQQDVVQFLEWLLQENDKAHHNVNVVAGRFGGSATAPNAGISRLSDLFAFEVQTRLHDVSSGGVRYASERDRFLRLNIPLEEAINKEEIEKAKQEAEKAAAAAATAAAESGSQSTAGSNDMGGEPSSKRPRLDDADSGEKAVEKQSELFRSGGAEQMAAAAAAGKAEPPSGSSAAAAAKAKASIPKPIIPLEALFKHHTSPSTSEDYLSPVTQQRGIAITTRQLVSCPKYLWVVLNRYITGDDWLPKKIDASITMPTLLDLGSLAPGYKISKDSKGLQAGEQDLDQLAAAAGHAAPAPAPAAAAPAAIKPDASLVSSLLEFGFPEGACKRACVATSNAGLEQATEWIMAHMDDADYASDYVEPVAAAAAPAPAAASAAPASASVDPELMMQLTSMGFDEDRAKYALKQANGNIERAADWLFSHMDEPLPSAQDDSAHGAGAGAGAGSAAAAAGGPPFPGDYASSGKYGLVGFISHMGTTTSSGHYVCHIHKKKENGEPVPAAGAGNSGEGEWFLFNDTKVMKSEAPPFDLGFVYLYQRLD